MKLNKTLIASPMSSFMLLLTIRMRFCCDELSQRIVTLQILIAQLETRMVNPTRKLSIAAEVLQQICQQHQFITHMICHLADTAAVKRTLPKAQTGPRRNKP